MSEYCRTLKEPEIAKCAYELICAFDEIVTLGYRDNVNVSQIRTNTEMDSHEEKLQEMLQKVKASLFPLQFSINFALEQRNRGERKGKIEGKTTRDAKARNEATRGWNGRRKLVLVIGNESLIVASGRS